MYTEDDDGAPESPTPGTRRFIMVRGAMKVPSMLPLIVLLAATGCGREARSADPNGETRFVSSTPATMSAPPDERSRDLRGPAGARATDRQMGDDARGRLEMTVRTAESLPGPAEDAPSSADRAADPSDDARSRPLPEGTDSRGDPAPSPERTEGSSAADGGPPVVRSDPARTPEPEPIFDRGLTGATIDQPPPVEVVFAPRGTELILRLEQELSSKKNQIGDVFYAEISEDVLAPDGMVLIPMGARARGRVWKSNPGDEEDRGEIELALDALIIADDEVPVTATVLETTPVVAVGQSQTEAATKVAAGAAAGAILGKILGKDTRVGDPRRGGRRGCGHRCSAGGPRRITGLGTGLGGRDTTRRRDDTPPSLTQSQTTLRQPSPLGDQLAIR